MKVLTTFFLLYSVFLLLFIFKQSAETGKTTTAASYLIKLHKSLSFTFNLKPEKLLNNFTRTKKVEKRIKETGCIKCHKNINQFTKPHVFDCSYCHRGNQKSDKIEEAHLDLDRKPLILSGAKKRCRSCHSKEVESYERSAMFNFKDKLDSLAIELKHALPSDCLNCHIENNLSTLKSHNNPSGCAACHFKKFSNPKEGREKFLHSFEAVNYVENCYNCHSARINSENISTADVHTKMSCRECHLIHDNRTKECSECHFYSKMNSLKKMFSQNAYSFGLDNIAHKTPSHLNKIGCTTCHSPIYQLERNLNAKNCNNPIFFGLDSKNKLSLMNNSYQIRTENDKELKLIKIINPHFVVKQGVDCLDCHFRYTRFGIPHNPSETNKNNLKISSYLNKIIDLDTEVNQFTLEEDFSVKKFHFFLEGKPILREMAIKLLDFKGTAVNDFLNYRDNLLEQNKKNCLNESWPNEIKGKLNMEETHKINNEIFTEIIENFSPEPLKEISKK